MQEGIWKLVFLLIIIVIIGVVYTYIKKSIVRAKNRFMQKAENAVMKQASDLMGPYAREITQGIVEAIKDDTPSVRTTGGATSVYLAKVQQDFKDFHREDANTDVQTFVLEFLQIKYNGQADFEKAKVSDRVIIPIGDKISATLTNIKINNMAIGDYQKSLNSATLKYRVSVGFNINGERKEKLYEIEYTLQLRNEYDSMALLQCKSCGAPIRESDGICPYCGTKHLRDTIENWVVTDVKEI